MELKNHILYPSLDLVDCVIDEVALEGLDGITLEALWQRLAIRLQEDLPLADSLIGQVWSICVKVKGFSFYELKKAREQLIIFDRFELMNDDEPKKAKVPKDIYPHFPIDDMRNGIRGSCSSYNTRIDITSAVRTYSLAGIAHLYGLKFIIVASQRLRERALIGDTACPVLEMNVLQYCFLERVGRARYHGDVSHGKNGLSTLADDPKSMFYHRKFLLKHKLIVKQAYSERVSGNSYSSSLLHLTRFYIERRPKFILVSESIINYLKTKDNYMASYDEVKEKLQIKVPLRKIFRTPLLKMIIRTDIKVPNKDLHPNAAEWQKNGYTLADKLVRAVQLTDPSVDINQFWGKHDVPDEDESYDLNSSKQKLNYPYLKQANRFVEESRQHGLSQTELGAKLGMTKLHTRTILRNLVKTKIVNTYMKDVGKQRVTKYISKKFANSSEISKQIEQEMDKMKEFNRTAQEEHIESIPPNVPIEVPNEVVYPVHEDIVVTDEVENQEVRRDEKLFPCVNKILSKYRTVKSRARYRYTALNLSQLHATAFFQRIPKRMLLQNDGGSNFVSYDGKAIKDVKIKLVCSRPQNVGRTKAQVTGFLENLKNKDTKNVTYRLLKRANLVIEAVKANKVIDDASKLLKLIKAEEDKEGYDVKIDKKSVARLLQKLAKDNLVKFIKLTLTDGDRQKTITYICDPSIDKSHTLIQSAVEQAKIKFCLLRTPALKISKKGAAKKRKGTINFVNPDDPENTNINLTLDARVGKKYGYSPKFLRMKALHIFLFYLIYEHPGHLDIPKEQQIEKLRNEGVFIDDKLAAEMTEMFTNEVNWKMFIPPLPKHPGWDDGWALMCDILLRLPLSVFTKVYNIPYIIPEIDTYLNHPIKKHFLVKDLSINLRNVLLKSRKYIFSVHETITRLCYLGLVQFGPQKLKEKDQVFLFLNRHSQLMDTTSTSIGYHKIEDKTYPIMQYSLKSITEVEKYWYDMWEICIHTCLGGRLAVQGKDILLEDLPKKAEMVKAAKPRPPEEVQMHDNGHVPGDRRGAAGIDSAFFAHLKRNWTWGNSNYTYQHYKLTGSKTNKVRVIANTTVEEAIEKSSQQESANALSRKESLREFAKFKKTSDKDNPKHDTILPQAKSARKPIRIIPRTEPRKKAYVRRVMPRKTTVRNRVKYDEVDYRALQRMDKLRVDWEPHEDNILLMCKVAMMYLFPNPRKQFVTFIAVRDTLRAYSSCSQNKTSRACQRRLLYMLKQPQTVSSVMLGIEEVKQNYFVNKRFSGLVDRIKSECHNPVEYEEKIAQVFKELVAYIAKKYYDISNMELRDPIIMPRTVHEFNLLYDLKHPSKTLKPKGFTKDVANVNDIHSAIINSVIHSSMCCGKDRRTWAYQLFKIYQQYPESLLRSAMFKIKDDQMVSVKKSSNTTFEKYGNCMPMSSSHYQLSLTYYYKFQTKWPYSVYSESYNLLLKMIQWHSEHQSAEHNYAVPPGVKGTEVLPITGGIVAGIHDFFAKEQLDFEIQMPDQIIMLDPRLQEKDEIYLKIAKRYQSLLMNCAYANEIAGPRKDNCPIKIPKIMSLNLEKEKEDNQEDNQEENQEDNSKMNVEDENENNQEVLHQVAVANNYTIENANTVFLEEPQINWSQNEGPKCMKTEKFDVRNIKRCLDSEDECHEVVEKRPKLDIYERSRGPVLKRPMLETEDESEREYDNETEGGRTFKKVKSRSINTTRQFYSCNIQKMQTLLRTSEEPSRSFQRAIALHQIPLEDDLNCTSDNLNENARENLAEDPLQFDPETDQTQNFLPQLSGDTDAIESGTGNCTRLGLLKMREEFNDISMADSHHAHDFFVVNSFNIFYALKLSDIQGPRKLGFHQGFQVPSEIIPLDLNNVNKLIDKIKTYAVFPKSPISYEEFRQVVSENSKLNWDVIDTVCNFIKEKRELGAMLQELAETFHELGRTLCEVLSILLENRQILRSGVTVVRYIYQQYIDPWLINSYKILRLEQEAQQTLPRGIVYTFSKENNQSQASKQKTSRQLDAKSLTQSVEISQKEKNNVGEKGNTEALNESSEVQECDQQTRRSLRKKTALLKETDVTKAARMLDLDSAEEIKVVIKPWIRIDGTLNRRVLDRMMGAVLSSCIKHPGTTLSKIQNRFIPAIHPFHIRELVEMLVELGCINIKVIKTSRVTLFSKPQKTKFSGSPDLAQDEEIVIEIEIGATLRFGTYLSTKNYNSDFLS